MAILQFNLKPTEPTPPEEMMLLPPSEQEAVQPLFTWTAAEFILAAIYAALGLFPLLGTIFCLIVGGHFASSIWNRRSDRISATKYERIVGDGATLRPDAWDDPESQETP